MADGADLVSSWSQRYMGCEVRQMHGLVLVLSGMLRQDAHGQLCQIVAEGQQQQGGDDVEDGVHVGDLSRQVAQAVTRPMRTSEVKSGVTMQTQW